MTGAGGDEDPRAPAGSSHYRRALIALFFAALATFAQIYAPQGLLPDIARDFEVSESASSLVIGATTIGLAVGMLPWGRLSDRVGRVAALRLALVSAVAVAVATVFAPNFETMIVLRFVEGLLLAGLPAIGVLALAETVRPLAFGAAVGGFVAGNSIGGLSGRLFSGWMADLFDWRGGMLAVTVLAGIAALIFMLTMPPTAVPPARSLPLVRAMVTNLRSGGVMVMVAQAFLLMGAFVITYNYLGFRLQHAPYELSTAQASLLFIAFLAGTFSSRAVWAIADRFTQVGVLLMCAGVMLAGIGIMMLPWLIAIIIGLAVLTMGFFGAHSIALALSSRRAQPAGRSVAASLYYMAYYAGSSVLGWAGGIAFASGGWNGASVMTAALVILAAGAAWVHAARRGGMRAVDA